MLYPSGKSRLDILAEALDIGCLYRVLCHETSSTCNYGNVMPANWRVFVRADKNEITPRRLDQLAHTAWLWEFKRAFVANEELAIGDDIAF